MKSQEKRAIEYMREWAREGFPRRVDGSFPTDVLTAMRWIMDVPVEKLGTRKFERAISAGKDFDYVLPSNWTWADTKDAKKIMGGDESVAT